MGTATPYVAPDPSLAWPIPYEAVESIASEEGLVLVAYQCIAGKWTIARGHTGGVHPNDKCTLEQGDQWFLDDIIESTDVVKSACTVQPDDNQLGALVSLCFNIGPEAFRASSVLRLHNKGDYSGAANAFLLWNKYHEHEGGPLLVSTDLDARRHREAAEYLQPMTGVQPSIPQVVAPPPSLASNPTMNAGAISSAIGVTAMLAEFSTTVKEPITNLVASAHDLGISPSLFVGGVALTLGGVVVYRTLQRRLQGKL